MNNDTKVGFLSLGCPKATVDSEHIVSDLLANGYDVVSSESAAEVVVVNTCGFIDAAKAESIQAIEELLDDGRRVVVTGCLGTADGGLRDRFPELEFVSGPAQVEPVIAAVKHYRPNVQATGSPLYAEADRTRLTPDHYAYLKISEGCNHKCSFCIIPSMRGGLASRDLGGIVQEAEAAVAGGAQELLLIAQDLSAYGLDLRYQSTDARGAEVTADLFHLVQSLAGLAPWLRLHYVYPYPSVDKLIPLMADGLVLPYLDMPLQHASPSVLAAMRRPAAAEKALERLQRWREICPDLAIRSTFIVGFPGETERDVGLLLDFLTAAELDRVGCFTYSAVEGARANQLADPIDERDKLDRQELVYEVQGQISERRLARHVGRQLRVLVDSVEDEVGQTRRAIARSQYDAPEIDGGVYVEGAAGVRPGEFIWVEVERSDSHDLYAKMLGNEIALR